MRFKNLEQQLYQIKKELERTDCWVSDSRIENIEALHAGDQTVYSILQSAYCPVKEGLVSIPPLELIIDRFKGERSKPKVFKSAMTAVKVTHGPQILPESLFHNYRLCGKFEIVDSFFDHYPDWSGNLFYSWEIKGEGLTYPILPPKLSSNIAEFKFIGSSFSDTIVNKIYSSRKKFIYSVAVRQEGQIDLRGVVSFKYLNPETRQYFTVQSTASKHVVLPARVSDDRLNSDASRNLIVLDLSQSMQIEDYQPSRAGAVLEGVRKVLASRAQCNTRIAVFGRFAVLLQASKESSCYSEQRLDSILFFAGKLGRGSSMADAIMLGNMLDKGSEKQEKLILISDGDNTFGFSTEFPAQIAKLRNIRIYSIGVGNRGIVPFGRNFFGVPNMVENTFDDSILKRISNDTGGKYFWAKDVAEIAEALEEILK